ncbi:MarR family winged helix-turn-helix transcriptional regulator [Streptomyces sp. NPDC059248]|uniref:MarR family winged helix-turn-helix transcriptional regulator n=2 Tax=unclassified Streptomyces TaxID=2593676 RepID=UPI0036A59906
MSPPSRLWAGTLPGVNGENGGGPAALERLMALAVSLRRVNGEMNRLTDAFATAHGLHATDVRALAAVLDAEEPVTPGMLRIRLGLTSGAVTACLDRLERAGHIRRNRDEADRRVVRVEYVDEARLAARAFFRPLAVAGERARSRFEDEELDVVLRFLDAFSEEMARLEEPPRPAV